MKKLKQGTRKLWLAMLSLVMLVALGMALVACGGSSKRINVPDRLEEDIGTGMYVVPRYEVVDQNGMILAGYNVTLKSATDPNGEAAEISRGVSTIVTISGPGEYKFVFTANDSGVKDATVIMDFADRKAPTVSMSSSVLPDFFINGNAYSIPEYSMNGDFDVTKCFTKVFYADEAGVETEVTVKDGQFKVDKTAGKYTILIHVEDAAGNFNEYRYTRKVDGPEQYDPNTVVYFNEAFGARQVEADGDYAGKFVSKDEAGGKAYGNEAGSYKVTFKGEETSNNEAYFNIRVPAIVNVMDYKELEMYVFIEDDGCEAGAKQWVVGSKWWNDHTAKVGEWTRITWSIENWGNGSGANVGAVNTNVISTDNIAGTRIRLIPDGDYKDKTPPHGTVYFSAMRAIPYDWSEIETEDGVSASASRVKYGETVTLTAEEKADKFFDCFIVDGKPISGDSFIASKDSHVVSVRYSDTEISKDNYSWGEHDFVAPGAVASDVNVHKIGNADVWALSYEITATNQENGNFYFGAYIGGSRQLAGVEFASWGKYLTLYGHVYSDNGTKGTVDERGHFSQEVQDALLGATAENPVKVTFVRNGKDFALYVTVDEVTMLAAQMDLTKFMAHAEYNNSFGYGWRSDFKNPTIQNIKYVVGETRTGYAKDPLDTVTVTAKESVTLDKPAYTYGETVTLSHGAAPSGKEFAYYKVNGERIDGNQFVVVLNKNEVEVVFNDVAVISIDEAFAGEIETADGKMQYVMESTVTLNYKGTPASGKYFDCFLVDGEPINGNSFVATNKTHTVGVKFFTDINDMTWGEEEFVAPGAVASDVKVHKIGNADVWVLSYEITATNQENGNFYFGAYIGGSRQLAGVEFATWGKYLTLYGHVYSDNGTNGTVDERGHFSQEVQDALLGASAENPVTVTFVRNGKDFALYVAAGDLIMLAAQMDLTKFMAHAEYNNSFGYGWRSDFKNPTIDNIQFITGEDKLAAYLTTFTAEIVAADSNIKLDKESYEIGDTVKLTATAPAGEAFSHFTLDGERIDGNTFVVTKKTHTVGVVFTKEVSTINLPADVTMDGENVVSTGKTVTLTYTGTNKNFDGFAVDGERIAGNSFVTTAQEHTVTILTFTNADDMTWNEEEFVAPEVSISTWGKAHKLGSSDKWVLSYDITATNAEAGGDWFMGVMVRGNQINGYEMGSAEHKNILGSAGSGEGTSWAPLGKLPAEVITMLNGASKENPVTLVFIRDGKTLSAYVKSGDTAYVIVKAQTLDTLDEKYGYDFGYGWRTDADAGAVPTITNIKYVTEANKLEAFIAAQKVTISKAESDTKVGTEKDGYVLGDTVTLTHAAADEGYGFSHYTVDGVALEAGKSTFKALKNSYTVGAVYVNLVQSYRLVVEKHDSFVWLGENGEYTLPVATLQDPEGEVVEGYTIIASVEDYTVTDNKITVSYRGAVTLKITYSVEELEGKDVEITVNVQPEDGTVFTVDENAASRIKANGTAATVAYNTDKKYGTEAGSLAITINEVLGNQDYAWMPAFEFGEFAYIETYVYVEKSGVQVGAHWYGDRNLAANQWTCVRLMLKNDNMKANGWVLRIMNVAVGDTVYFSSSTLKKFDGGAILDLSYGAGHGEWTNEKVYDGDDAAVDTTGSLKVTATSGDFYSGFTANPLGVMLPDVTGYSKIYFYVYTETEDAAILVGTTWAGDTNPVAGQWTKVEIDTSDNIDTKTQMQEFRFRIQKGQDQTFYITSVYGIK